jgi:hypothetical protein
MFGLVSGTLVALPSTSAGAVAVAGHVLLTREHTAENWQPLWIATWALPAAVALGAVNGCLSLLLGRLPIASVDVGDDGESVSGSTSV